MDREGIIWKWFVCHIILELRSLLNLFGHNCRLSKSTYVTFWALFGQIESEEFKTDHPYDVIEYTGLFLFGVFNVIAVLVALNMLIAMLNTSYSNITVRYIYFYL